MRNAMQHCFESWMNTTHTKHVSGSNRGVIAIVVVMIVSTIHVENRNIRGNLSPRETCPRLSPYHARSGHTSTQPTVLLTDKRHGQHDGFPSPFLRRCGMMVSISRNRRSCFVIPPYSFHSQPSHSVPIPCPPSSLALSSS